MFAMSSSNSNLPVINEALVKALVARAESVLSELGTDNEVLYRVLDPESQIELWVTRHALGDRGITIVVVQNDQASPFPSGQELASWFGLTRREAQVALLLAARRSNDEIASQLGVTTFTAWRHTEKVLNKLGITKRNDVEAVLRTWRPSSANDKWRPGSYNAS